MASIADIFFSARLEDGGLQTDAKKAGDKAGLTLGQRMSSGIKKQSSNIFAGLSVGAGIAAFGLLDRAVSGTIGFLGDATQAARDEELSIEKLGAALRANIKDWDGNTKSIEDVLAARMDLGFSDDEQRSSLALLVSVTKDYNVALGLQRTAMDLARLRGIDLAAAGDIVGKVYGGNIGILSRYGIQLKKGITPAEALAEVQARAAGQAAAWAETNEGKLARSQIKVGEAMERLGGKILPIVADAMMVVADVTEDVIDVFVAISESPVGDALGFIGEAAGNAAKGLGFIVDGVGDFIAKTGDYETRMEAMRGSTVRVFGSFREAEAAMRAGADGLIGTADDLASAIPEKLDEAREKAVEIARRTPGEIAAALREKRSAWQDAVDLLGRDLENEMSAAAEIASIRAQLAGENIAKGLKSKDPIVRAQAEETVRILNRRLAELSEDARTHGANAGQSLANGLNSKQGAVANSALNLARIASKYLKVSSPAELGPWSEEGGPEGWGENFGETLAEGIRRTARSVRDAVASVAAAPLMPSLGSALAVPSFGSLPSVASTDAAPGPVTRINNITVPITGLLKGRDPFEVADRLRRFADNGAFDPPEEFS